MAGRAPATGNAKGRYQRLPHQPIPAHLHTCTCTPALRLRRLPCLLRWAMCSLFWAARRAVAMVLRASTLGPSGAAPRLRPRRALAAGLKRRTPRKRPWRGSCRGCCPPLALRRSPRCPWCPLCPWCWARCSRPSAARRRERGGAFAGAWHAPLGARSRSPPPPPPPSPLRPPFLHLHLPHLPPQAVEAL